MSHDRPNRTLSAAIDLILTVVDEVGTAAAADYLADRGASFAVICRVLSEPDRRRAARRAPASEAEPPKRSPPA